MTIHEFEPFVPDLSRPPLEDGDGSLTIARDDLPTVHTVHKLPHIHLTDEAGEDYVVHTVAGDSPRDLVLMGMHYIALGMALREKQGMGWDEKWTGPKPEDGPHSHE